MGPAVQGQTLGRGCRVSAATKNLRARATGSGLYSGVTLVATERSIFWGVGRLDLDIITQSSHVFLSC